ncbi:hypothetical protein PLEOSDRAFT_1100760 [Pleurotus ostreatus PC15]|uniref:Uncharacterized protein n=1 Tax=Pleurotus ostreatus (strain PC15) TaxID=1137138 RepID=A0A067P8Q2_PLEO1|nr:hypothetical protein PLEOSDRAFT_1100760 [Pleurotus ostreatus PC15]
MGNAASQHADLPSGARITTSALNVPTLDNDDPSLRDRQRSREQNMTEALFSSPRRRRIRHNDENTPPMTFVAQTRASSRASGGTTPLRPIQNTVFPGFGRATPPATQGPRAASAHQRGSETFLTAPTSVPDQCTAATLSRRAQAQRDRRARERAQRQSEALNCEHSRNSSRSHIRVTEPLTPPAMQPRNIVRAPAPVEPLMLPITQLPNAVREHSLAEPSTSLMSQPANAAREQVSEIGIMTPPQTQSHPRPSQAVGGRGARLQQCC